MLSELLCVRYFATASSKLSTSFLKNCLCWSKKPAPSTHIYSGEAHGSLIPCPWRSPPPLQLHLLHSSAWGSPAGELQAPPPRRRAAGALPQLLLSPCWIKKEETSPGCTCVEHGGTVVWCLDRIRPRSESLSERLHRPRSCNASASRSSRV